MDENSFREQFVQTKEDGELIITFQNLGKIWKSNYLERQELFTSQECLREHEYSCAYQLLTRFYELIPDTLDDHIAEWIRMGDDPPISDDEYDVSFPPVEESNANDHTVQTQDPDNEDSAPPYPHFSDPSDIEMDVDTEHCHNYFQDEGAVHPQERSEGSGYNPEEDQQQEVPRSRQWDPSNPEQSKRADSPSYPKFSKPKHKYNARRTFKCPHPSCNFRNTSKVLKSHLNENMDHIILDKLESCQLTICPNCQQVNLIRGITQHFNTCKRNNFHDQQDPDVVSTDDTPHSGHFTGHGTSRGRFTNINFLEAISFRKYHRKIPASIQGRWREILTEAHTLIDRALESGQDFLIHDAIVRWLMLPKIALSLPARSKTQPQKLAKHLDDLLISLRDDPDHFHYDTECDRKLPALP
jgi:hypothetical protein